MAVAREIVLRQLTVRARSRQELATALRTRGVPDEAAEQVLERFTELRLIDDEAFASQWVDSGKRRLRSRSAISQQLRTKGVDADTLAAAVSSVSDDEEYTAALTLARKRAAACRGVDAATRYRRVAGALARRGFGSSVTHRAVKEALAELGDDADGVGAYADETQA